MEKLRVIITGVTGMVGEGVLLECTQNPAVAEIMILGRRHYNFSHPKVKELLVPDFSTLSTYADQLKGYDACFYCAGVSSIGMSEEDYAKVTYTTTLSVAKTLHALNPNMVFNFVTGLHTDSTEKGKMMWARVKGKTENDLMKVGFRGQYNFRPGVMVPVAGQKNVKAIFKPIIFIYAKLSSRSLTLNQVGRAMVNSVTKGYKKQVLEIDDIKALAT